MEFIESAGKRRADAWIAWCRCSKVNAQGTRQLILGHRARTSPRAIAFKFSRPSRRVTQTVRHHDHRRTKRQAHTVFVGGAAGLSRDAAQCGIPIQMGLKVGDFVKLERGRDSQVAAIVEQRLDIPRGKHTFAFPKNCPVFGNAVGYARRARPMALTTALPAAWHRRTSGQPAGL